MFRFLKIRKIKRKVSDIETLIFLTRDSLLKQINNVNVHIESIEKTTKLVLYEEDLKAYKILDHDKRDIIYKNINTLKVNNNVVILPNLYKDEYINISEYLYEFKNYFKCYVLGISQSDIYHLRDNNINEDILLRKWPNFKELECCSTFIKRIVVDESVKTDQFDDIKPILNRMKLWTENIAKIIDIYPGAKDECLIKKVFKLDDLIITRDINLHNQLKKDNFNSLFVNGTGYCTFTSITKNDVKNGNYNSYKDHKINDQGFDEWIINLKRENVINKVSSTIYIDRNLVFIEQPYGELILDKKLIKTNTSENVHDVSISTDGAKFLRRGYLIENVSTKIGVNTFIDVQNLEDKYTNYENLGFNLDVLKESIETIIENINTKSIGIGKYDSHVFWADKMYLKFPSIFKNTKIYDVIGTRISSTKEEKLISLLSEIDYVILDNQNPFELKTKGVSKTLDSKTHKYIALDRSYIKDEIFFGLSKTEFTGHYTEPENMVYIEKAWKRVEEG